MEKSRLILKAALPNLSLVACLLIMIICTGYFSTQVHADSAKQKYMAADDCYKKLRNSSLERQKISGWLNCIGRYETIYKDHPGSSWAPAGMYKAAELSLQLSKQSGNTAHKFRAIDLLARIKNKYPDSAYSKRAKILEKSLVIKHIRSKKEETRNDRLMAKFNKSQKNRSQNNLTPNKTIPKELDQKTFQALVQKPAPRALLKPASKKVPKWDTHVTKLRFWSNPEYTRIVINAQEEREFSHRLLKKDPAINKPFQRLYIDIEKTRLARDVAEHIPINDNLLSQARAGQYLPHTVRVVVDIKSFENYKIFSLKDPFRIIIDVWGKGSNGSPTALGQTIAKEEPVKKVFKTTRITTDNLKSSELARQLALSVKKIIIDPGHGGPDPGAPGYVKDVWEKDIVLKLALNLAAKLRTRLNCTVELTRSTDKKLTLEERTAIANTQRADLFISMHCNAAKNKKLTGFETYILNLATDDQSIAVAARENATSKKNISDLEYILSDFMKNDKI
jgi:N-acetylmuramoyl-L-alanine amidase